MLRFCRNTLWGKLLIALCLPLLSALLRMTFLGVLGTHTPFLIFYPFVVITSLLGGVLAGLVSGILSCLLASYFWLSPGAPLTFVDWLGIWVFLFSCSVISILAEALHRARARAVAAEAVNLSSQALQRERQFLRQVIDSLPSTLFVKDREGTYLLANRAMAHVMGTTVKGVEGKNEQDFAVIPPDEMARLLEEDQVVFEKRETIHSASKIVAAGGRRHTLETVKSPILDQDGGCGKMLVVTNDVTEREQAEDALRQNRKLLDSIVSGTSDAVFVKDAQGKYLLVNRATEEVVGRGSADILGRDDLALFSAEEARRVMERDRAMMEQRTTETAEETLTDALGKTRVFLATKGPIYDDHGNVTGLFGISRDITDLKRVQDQVRQLNEELDRRVAERTVQLENAIREQEAFSYSVSHDLRSPLRHINSFAAIIEEECADHITPLGAEYLGRIRQASRKMGKLIDDLLELARMSRSLLQMELVDLSRLAETASATLRHSDPSREVNFVIAPQIRVLGDKTLMHLVVENLFSNAWKYTSKKERARIEFGTKEVDGVEVIFIKDDGAGFDMAYSNKLFGPFERLHGPEFEGNGIGLATVKRAIERHGGSVWAEGEVDKGATFSFTLGRPAEYRSTAAA